MNRFSLLLVFFMFNYLNSQDLKLYEKESFVFENDTLNYRILKPLNYNVFQGLLYPYLSILILRLF